MMRWLDELAAWASLLGTITTLLGLLQTATSLTIVGLCLIVLSTLAVWEARRSRRLLQAASLSVEGLHVDSLNLANLRRRLSRSLVVQRAYHRATIHRQDLAICWQYEGYCRTETASTIEFSIDAESHTPFRDLECAAFDLQHDPERRHPIRPILLGQDGLSKKVAVPFLVPLRREEPFRVLLQCMLPGCLTPGVQYYTSTLSFDQQQVNELCVHLVFVGPVPEWVRVYEPDGTGQPTLRQELPPHTITEETCEYVDVAQKIPGQCTRIYVFSIGSGIGISADTYKTLPE